MHSMSLLTSPLLKSKLHQIKDWRSFLSTAVVLMGTYAHKQLFVVRK